MCGWRCSGLCVGGVAMGGLCGVAMGGVCGSYGWCMCGRCRSGVCVGGVGVVYV